MQTQRHLKRGVVGEPQQRGTTLVLTAMENGDMPNLDNFNAGIHEQKDEDIILKNEIDEWGMFVSTPGFGMLFKMNR